MRLEPVQDRYESLSVVSGRSAVDLEQVLKTFVNKALLIRFSKLPLTPLTYIRVGDEVIVCFKCIEDSYELIEVPSTLINYVISHNLLTSK